MNTMTIKDKEIIAMGEGYLLNAIEFYLNSKYDVLLSTLVTLYISSTRASSSIIFEGEVLSTSWEDSCYAAYYKGDLLNKLAEGYVNQALAATSKVV